MATDMRLHTAFLCTVAEPDARSFNGPASAGFSQQGGCRTGDDDSSPELQIMQLLLKCVQHPSPSPNPLLFLFVLSWLVLLQVRSSIFHDEITSEPAYLNSAPSSKFTFTYSLPFTTDLSKVMRLCTCIQQLHSF
jgi:hypothetical protein